MTPKQKAIELIEKLQTKENAIICVDEIINLIIYNQESIENKIWYNISWWRIVKNEIIKYEIPKNI